MAELNPKQQRFVSEYLIDLNGTQAARRAGYSPATANEQASRLLADDNIRQAVKEKMAEREARTEITQDRVLKEFAKIGFADLRRAVTWGSAIEFDEESGDAQIANGIALRDSKDIDDDTAAAIAEVSQTKEGFKIKLHDKKGALESIGRHLGMFKDKMEVTGKDGGPVQYATLTTEQLHAEARALLALLPGDPKA